MERRFIAWARRPLARVAALALILAAPQAGLRASGAQDPRTLVFFGDSLTAGYGLADPATQSYPAQIQGMIDAQRLPWRVVNAGLSGETSAGGLRRIDWVLRQRADVFVLELGGNDGLRGTATEETRSNLQAIIDRVHSRYPAAVIVLAGMRMPGNMGPDYADAFRAIYPGLAQRNGLALIPFLLDGVAGRPELNQPDGIHPTASGAAIVAAGVWKTLEPILRAER
jgi:acyl-CoA thioesterase-1